MNQIHYITDAVLPHAMLFLTGEIMGYQNASIHVIHDSAVKLVFQKYRVILVPQEAGYHLHM